MKKRLSNSGFTLLEVMIAVAILAVSLMAIFGLQSTSLLSSSRAQRITISTQLARLKMAQILMELEEGMAKGEFPEEKEDSGVFEEEPDYGWRLKVRKVEIPVPPMPEGSADVLAQIFSMVSEQISQSTREVKLTIVWRAPDDEEQVGIELVTHIVKM